MSAPAIPEPESAQPPLVVHVVRQFLPNRGGLEDVVANLARETHRQGYRLRIVTLDSLFTARDRGLPARETLDGLEVRRIPWSGSSRYPLAPQVFRHLGDADLVHVHAIDFFFDALAWGRWLHGKPMLVTTHGGFFHTQAYAAIKAIWFKTLTRASARAYGAVVGCSDSDVEQFSRIAPQRTLLIENGVDIGKFAGAASPIARRRIVTIGRFSVNKRLDRLIDTMRVLHGRHADWHLDIVGAPSDLSGADLDSMIAEAGLQTAVTLHVSAENERIRHIISEASLFASASDYEGFGLVALEAMSAGLLPVLHVNEAYRALAKRHEILALGDFGDAETAADAMEAAFARLEGGGHALQRQLMEEAQAYAWSTVSRRYIDLYRKLGLPPV